MTELQQTPFSTDLHSRFHTCVASRRGFKCTGFLQRDPCSESTEMLAANKHNFTSFLLINSGGSVHVEWGVLDPLKFRQWKVIHCSLGTNPLGQWQDRPPTFTWCRRSAAPSSAELRQSLSRDLSGTAVPQPTESPLHLDHPFCVTYLWISRQDTQTGGSWHVLGAFAVVDRGHISYWKPAFGAIKGQRQG